MKIGFDISQLAHRGGVATYTANLAKALLPHKDLDLTFFYSSLRKPYTGNLPNVRSFPLPPTISEILFNRFRKIPIESLIGEIDIFHSSDWIQPPSKAKKVTTYHDVVPLKYPQWSHPKIVEVHKRRLRLVEEEIDMVIAVSEATKKDLMEISNIPQNKITVIYEGVGEHFYQKDREETEEFRRKYKLPEEFILAIGGVGERRNLDRVKEVTKDNNLLITGKDLPYLSDSEMPLLYSAATLLLYPSFYEGFGLPILEAMACGVPVITSNVSSMPEVAGDAAVLVDPLDLNSMIRVIREIMEDKGFREELRKKGLARAKKFSWEKCAEETADVYRGLAK